MRRNITSLIAAAALAAVSVAASPPDGITIESPENGSYVSGVTLLRASIDPSVGPVVRVTFFADGKSVCVIEAPPFQCEWDAGPNVVDHYIRVVAQLADGRRLSQNARTNKAAFADNVDVDVVQVTATVTDGGGRFIRGLARQAFRVFEDRVPQRITHFQSENVPLELVVAIDMSGSMTDAMPAVKAAVKTFLAKLRPTDQVTLLGFNNDILTLARRESSPAARIRAVERLRPWGGTALYDVIVRSIDQLGRQQGRRALVIFSDGDDQSSHVSLEDVERRVDASDATLYLVGQGRASTSADLKRILDRLANVSGGRAVDPASVDALDGHFGEIVEELSNQYLLAYPPTNMARTDAWRQIDVEVTQGNYKVRARKGYRALQRKR
jgi:VWFA-related protein